MGGDWGCEDASREEFNAIDCQVGWSVTNKEFITDFDNWSEELVFLEAAQRTHQVGQCQVKLHSKYETDPLVAETMKQNAYIQFHDIRSQLSGLLRERRDAQRALDQARANSNYAEDRLSGTADETFGYENRMATNLSQVNGRLNSLLSRVPMGNREEMRNTLIDLMGQRNLTENQFYVAYDRVMRELAAQARQTDRFFTEIQRPLTNAEGHTGYGYAVNEELKKSLVKSGQIENVVHSLGLNDQLSNGFSCRVRARYERGPTNLALAEIPFYFTGIYGLGRLGVRAGVGVIRATTSTARATASATAMASRAAMLGIEGYMWARIAEQTKEACFPPEYLAAIQNTAGCTEDSEIDGVYQDASIAQCLTTAAINVAPVAFVGAVRVWNRGATRAVPRGVVARRVADEVPPTTTGRALRSEPEVTTIDEIVVTAPRRRSRPQSVERAPGAQAWSNFSDVRNVQGLEAADKTFLQSYLRRLPRNTQERLRNHFRGQSPEATLRDLRDMRDLSRINSCR